MRPKTVHARGRQRKRERERETNEGRRERKKKIMEEWNQESRVVFYTAYLDKKDWSRFEDRWYLALRWLILKIIVKIVDVNICLILNEIYISVKVFINAIHTLFVTYLIFDFICKEYFFYSQYTRSSFKSFKNFEVLTLLTSCSYLKILYRILNIDRNFKSVYIYYPINYNIKRKNIRAQFLQLTFIRIFLPAVRVVKDCPIKPC